MLFSFLEYTSKNKSENSSKSTSVKNTLSGDSKNVKIHDAESLSDVVQTKITVEGVQTDIVSDVYEGGDVIWECSLDLKKFLRIHKFNPDVKIIELGCGHGLPSISLLTTYPDSSSTLQDYNKSSLAIAKTNLEREKISADRVKFIESDWSDLTVYMNEQDLKYDVVLASECTYNKESYDKLHECILSASHKETRIFLAMKSTYFGVGGSYYDWEKFVDEKGCFDKVNLEEYGSALKRYVIEYRLK